jgi:hypothetical protein
VSRRPRKSDLYDAPPEAVLMHDEGVPCSADPLDYFTLPEDFEFSDYTLMTVETVYTEVPLP